MLRFAAKLLIVMAIAGLFLAATAQPVEARAQMRNGLVDADFFASSSWNYLPGVNDVFRADQNGSGSTVIIDFTTADAQAATGGATSWSIGTAAGAESSNMEYPSVQYNGAATTSITQLNGDMTFFGPNHRAGDHITLAVNVQDITDPNGAGEAHGIYTLETGSTTINTGIKLGTIGNANSTAIFNQNGGVVTLSGGQDRNGNNYGDLQYGHSQGTYWFGTARYNLNAGVFQLENIVDITADNGSSNAVNFGADSTGIMYVNTANKSEADIEGMITAGEILLGDAVVAPSEFIINELGSGDFAGYTEVKLVPEPSTLVLVGFGLLSLAVWGWRRRP